MICLAIAGPSGVGKSTVAERLMSDDKSFALSISATTRERRSDGESDYIHMDRESFEALIEKGDMLEYTEYNGNLYGTPRQQIEKIAASGKNPLLILDLNGIKSLKTKELGVKVVSVYIYEDINVIEQRLYDRYLKDEPTAEKLSSFVKRKNQNISDYVNLEQYAEYFDFFLKNEELDKAVSELKELIASSEAQELSHTERQKVVDALYNMALKKA
jgi:guanylate kinase